MPEDTSTVVWVHGIGPAPAGYSAPWSAAYAPALPGAAFREVLWGNAYAGPPPTTPLAAADEAIEDLLRQHLGALLSARAVTNLAGPFAADLSPDVLGDQYLPEAATYLAHPAVRAAVRARVAAALGPAPLVVAAHSWGTVVAYEALCDLAARGIDLGGIALVTMGSPLWAVRPFLDYKVGTKPAGLIVWLNVVATGDLGGAPLGPGYQVDRDVAIPSIGPDPHGTYFQPGNGAIPVVAEALAASARAAQAVG